MKYPQSHLSCSFFNWPTILYQILEIKYLEFNKIEIPHRHILTSTSLFLPAKKILVEHVDSYSNRIAINRRKFWSINGYHFTTYDVDKMKNIPTSHIYKILIS